MHLPATIRAFYLNTVTRDVVCITIHSNDTSANKHCMLYYGTPLNISQHILKKNKLVTTVFTNYVSERKNMIVFNNFSQ